MRFQPSHSQYRPPVRDEFDDPQDDRGGVLARVLGGDVLRRYKVPLIGAGLFLAVVGFSSLMVMAMSSADAASSGQVPLMRADATPYKVVPEDRGGMDVPNLGTTVFENIREGSGSKVENLLADEGKPVAKDQAFAASENAAGAPDSFVLAGASRGFRGKENPLSAAEKRALQAEKNEDAVVDEAPPLPGQGVKLTPEKPLQKQELQELARPEKNTPDPRTIDAEKVEEVGEGEATPPAIEDLKPIEQAARPKADAPPEPKPTTTGDTFIQLASIKDKAAAAGHWNKLQTQFSSLSGLDYRVKSVDLGAKGTFHRIQAGPMSGDQAASVCAAIKTKQPGACLIVKE